MTNTSKAHRKGAVEVRSELQNNGQGFKRHK